MGVLAFPSIPASKALCVRYFVIRYTKFEWAAAYRKTIAKIANYRESTKRNFEQIDLCGASYRNTSQ